VKFEGAGNGIWPKPSRFGEPFGIRQYFEEITAFKGTARPRPRELKRHLGTGDRTVILIGHQDDWLTAYAEPQIVDSAIPFDYCEVQFGWRALRPEPNYAEMTG
jgi:hypothetical protein